jgi:hypothetical protein
VRVFLASFLLSSWDITRFGIAAAYSDPIQHIRAQDEALYVNSAIGITRDGDWLTPKFQGRPFFLKPPLLMWLSALCIRVFGLSLFAARLPALIFGAAGVAAVFIWIAQSRSILVGGSVPGHYMAGLIGSSILVMSPLWQTFSRLCYTDMPAASCSALALVAVALDVRLEKRSTAIWFGAFSGGAVLSKSLAGLLPVAALAVFLVVSRTRLGWSLKSRIFEMTLAGLVVAAPWHIYQLLVHRQWFWAEGVKFQLLGVGLKGMPTGDFSHSFFFYIQRLWQMDPVLLALGLIGLVCLVPVLRARERTPQLLAFCWIAVTMAAMAAFQAKNLPYLVFLIPGLVILGTGAGPKWLDRRPAFAWTFLLILFGWKALEIDKPISLRPGARPIEGARAIRAYYDLGRDTELMVAQPDDEFYSATIPLPHVRYVLVDPTEITARTLPYYVPLGIVMTGTEFVHLPELMPGYKENLRKWGFDSTEPVGSTIVIKQSGELLKLVQSRPQCDFYAPSDWDLKGAESSHWVIPYSSERVFLLSRSASARRSVPNLPDGW